MNKSIFTVFTRIKERTVIKAFLLFQHFPNKKSDSNIRKKLLLFETKEKKYKTASLLPVKNLFSNFIRVLYYSSWTKN